MRSRVTCFLATALVAVLPLPSVARAGGEVTIRGGGWGHGMGMSQYGAYGRAQNGATVNQILEHYYSNAQVRTADMPPSIRVGLLQYKSSISASSDVFSSGVGRMVFKAGGTRIAEGDDAASWRVERSATGGMRLYKNGRQVERDGKSVFGNPATPLVAIYEKYGSKIRIEEKNNSYAYGRMVFGTYPSPRCGNEYCLRLIVVLSMQKYLYGLGEVPSSWPEASLRSQAIAGRTYAFEKVQRSGQHRYPCDCAVYDSTLDQAYIGDAKRTGSGVYWDDWKGAVDATDAKVVEYQGAPIQALYSSSSGGYTENNENVWGGTAIPYLRGVPDKPDAVDANPNHTWSVSMTWSAFESKLNAAYGIGRLQSFSVVRPRGVSGRVTVVKPDNTGGARVVGSRKTVRVSGWSVRSALALKDTLFWVAVSTTVGSNLLTEHRRLDGGPGEPTGEPYPVPLGWDHPLGQAQQFEKGRMTWTRSTDKTVWQYGPVLRKYNRVGREKSSLGMPISDIWGPGSWQAGSYAGGMIAWSETTGAHTVRGTFRAAYKKTGGPSGTLGLPTREQEARDTLPDGGRRQRFVTGTLYLNPKLDSVPALWSPIDARYRRMGEATSRCGYPTSSVTTTDSGTQATFEHGVIVSTDAGVTVDCGV